MKGRVGRLIMACLLISMAGLLLATTGCQRAKPPRTVAPPLITPRLETPVIARVAMATATADAVAAAASSGYPGPSAPATLVSQEAYPPTEEPPTPAPTPTEAAPAPTAALTSAPTSVPTAAPTVAPEATPTSVVVPPTPLPEIAYRVRPGDSVGSIAVLFNSTTAAILARNGLNASSVIQVGQVLIIPATSTETIPTGTIVEHRVQAGETLELIAGYYRTTVAAILGQNPGVSEAQDLVAGTVLTVIAGSEKAARTHVVQVGESLSTIAESYGLTTQALARANGLADPSRVRVGQTLIIP